MRDKKLLWGLLLGMIIGGITPVYSYYTSYTPVCELTAKDVQDIVEDAIKDSDVERTVRKAIRSCNFREGGGHPRC